jgi:glutathione reductase (NADPH)
MAEQYDLVVIGSGSAGMGGAKRCREAGWRVALIDSRRLGGTCALRGCDPKKVLVGAAEVVDRARRLKGFGMRGEPRIEWSELMDFKRSFTEPVPSSRAESLQESGIDLYQDRARFKDDHTLRVGSHELRAGHILLANGSRPATLKIPGEDLLTMSDDFLDLDSLPKRIAFVGGGFISFEFAHLASRAGAKTFILHRGERPLKRFEPDLVELLVDATRQAGIEVVQAEVTGLQRKSEGLEVSARTGQRTVFFEADMAVHGAGRVPDIDDLEPETGSVELERGGISVSQHLQSVSNPNVYAAGDVSASKGLPVTPVAALEGLVAAENILHGNCRIPSYKGLPSVVFTIPPLAAVGISEQEARDHGYEVQVKSAETSDWYSSRRIGEGTSAYKTIVDRNSGQLLGAHLLQSEAEEAINLFALMIRSQLKVDSLRDLLPAYPSRGSDLQYMV